MGHLMRAPAGGWGRSGVQPGDDVRDKLRGSWHLGTWLSLPFRFTAQGEMRLISTGNTEWSARTVSAKEFR